MNTIWQYYIPDVCGLGLSFELDGFRLLYGVISTFMWLECLLFSKEYMAHQKNKGRYYFFTIATYGATMGVFLSGDLFTTFLFFELMSLTSYVWVAQEEKKESLRAAATYLTVAVLGGLVMLMGLFMLYDLTGSLKIDILYEACKPFWGDTRLYVAGGCLLFGFGAKAGAFPMHIWLPKAHPVAPAPASALLSGILTKTGVFGIIIITSRIFTGDAGWGTLILTLGIITMVLGALLALCSVDLKRTLACSSMSQIGFILVGIGMQALLGGHGTIAAWGTVLHMMNHSLFKLVLFLAAGTVYMNLHRLNLNEIRGFGRNKPLLKGIFLMGAMGIAGVPLWSGYISKTLLHESIVEYGMLLAEGIEAPYLYGPAAIKIIEWIFLISGGLTCAYMLKLFVAVFVEKNKEEKRQKQYEEKKAYWKKTSAACLMVAAIIIPVLGCIPKLTMEKLARMAQSFMGTGEMSGGIHYFSLINLIGSLVSIGTGILVYVFIVRKVMIREGKYVDIWPLRLDLEERVYNPLLLRVLPLLSTIICRFLDRLVDGIVVLLRKTVYRDSPLPRELQEGNLFTHYVGHFLDLIIHGMNKTVWLDNQKEEDQEHKLSLLYETFSENNTIIGRSLSFGLFMSLAGLVAVLIYLLSQF